MCTSWLGYESWDINAPFYKFSQAFWNSDGTLLIQASNDPPERNEKGERVYRFGGNKISVTLTPKELRGLLDNPPAELFSQARLVPGMFPSWETLEAQSYSDDTIMIGSIRLPKSEWKLILDGCLIAGNRFCENIGIFPLLGTNCVNETKEMSK